VEDNGGKMEVCKNKKGQIAVLVSGGFGAGWSTWNQPELAYDKRVVEFLVIEEGRSKLYEID
jgi:hypothetical protein